MITELRLKRFKCFEDITVKFGGITLMTGINGAGKSTIIQALLLLRQAYLTGNLQNGKLPLNGDIINIGTATDALFAGAKEDGISFVLKLDNPDEKIEAEFFYSKEDPNQYTIRSSSKNIPKISAFASLFTWDFNYITAERLGPRIIYPMSKLPDNRMNVGARGEFAAHCLDKFGDLPISNKKLALKTEEGTLNFSLSHQVQLRMNDFIPNIALHTESIDKADSVRLEVKTFDDQTEYLRPTNMGFGFCYTLPIIVAALMAKPGSMLIVENPEAHLHPRGQSKIAKFLSQVAAGGVQVIIETHSDHILNGLRLSVKEEKITPEDVSILYFGRDKKLGGNKTENLKIFKDGGIKKWPVGFFDQLELDLEDLL
jgi:predicted ATPase